MRYLIVFALLVGVCACLFAGSVDYVTNQSVPFLRTLSRNAATDETDVVVYNPAGTVWMPDGMHLSFHYQGFTKDYAIKDLTTGTEYKTTMPSPFIPSVFLLAKHKNLATFLAFTIPAGGGSVEYEDGLMMTSALSDAYFKGTSLYYGITGGFAYKFDDILSFSMAYRGIISTKEYEGSGTHPLAGTLALDSKKTANGIGGIFGVNLNLGKGNVAVRYETQTTLKYDIETKVNSIDVDGFDDGTTEYRDLPAQLSIGLSYDVNDHLRLNLGSNTFFLNRAAQNNPAYELYDDGSEFQLGAEYKFNNQWLVSAGYNYVVIGGNKDTYTDFEYQLDAHFVGAGFRYSPNDQWKINFALAKPFYETSKGISGAEYSKDVNILGLSVEHSF